MMNFHFRGIDFTCLEFDPASHRDLAVSHAAIYSAGIEAMSSHAELEATNTYASLKSNRHAS